MVYIFPYIFLSVGISTLHSHIIHVPSDSTTIQAGINGTVDGDTVLVADGTYSGEGNRDIDFSGRAIVVMSEDGAENCVLDCGGSDSNPHRGFHFHNNEDSLSVLQGFMIKNGYLLDNGSGGGVYCNNSSPILKDNIILDCYAYYGGGIMVWGNSSPRIEGNTLIGNESDQGGGIGCQHYSSPYIVDNTIVGNSANHYGGGIRCSYSTVTISGNVIYGNSAYWGGGLYSNNNPASTVMNNTILENIASNGGSGIMINYSSPIVLNCIVRDNSYDEIFLRGTSYPTVEYNNVEGGWPGIGNIDDDPLFVLPGKRDYRLLWGSACIDNGHPIHFDEDGTRSDIGAHFFDQDDYLTVYITPDTNEVSPGSELGITYTIINRWSGKEPFIILGRAIQPDGTTYNLLGPNRYRICAGYTAQIWLNYEIPQCTYPGIYIYQCSIGLPPSTIYDMDRCRISIVELSKYNGG